MIEMPRLSQLVKPFSMPEKGFVDTVKDVTGITLPPGPASILVQMTESIENSKGGGIFAALPRIEGLPGLEELLPRGFEEGLKGKKEEETVEEEGVVY